MCQHTTDINSSHTAPLCSSWSAPPQYPGMSSESHKVLTAELGLQGPEFSDAVGYSGFYRVESRRRVREPHKAPNTPCYPLLSCPHSRFRLGGGDIALTIQVFGFSFSFYFLIASGAAVFEASFQN